MRFEKGDKVCHYKNDKIYTIVEFGKVQWHNMWHECVIYEHKGEIFVRSLGDFKDSFLKIN